MVNTKRAPRPKNQNMDASDRLFHSLDIESKGYIAKNDLAQALLDRGILLNDMRIRQTAQDLNKLKEKEKINIIISVYCFFPHFDIRRFFNIFFKKTFIHKPNSKFRFYNKTSKRNRQ